MIKINQEPDRNGGFCVSLSCVCGTKYSVPYTNDDIEFGCKACSKNHTIKWSSVPDGATPAGPCSLCPGDPPSLPPHPDKPKPVTAQSIMESRRRLPRTGSGSQSPVPSGAYSPPHGGHAPRLIPSSMAAEYYRGQVVLEGPGKELRKLIPKIFDRPGCGCEKYAQQMNQWGVDGCRERYDEIVSHIVAKAKQYAIPELLSKPVIKRMLNQAIEEAGKKDD